MSQRIQILQTGKSLGFVGLLSILGIVATFLFQIATARMLNPGDYGLVAAFLAIVNIAAVGAGALQNSVAVQVARKPEFDAPMNQKTPKALFFLFKKLDATTVEAGLLGISGGVTLLLFSNLISGLLNTQQIIIVIAAVTIPLSFFISRDLGILQGKHRTIATVGWSTFSAVFRLILVTVLLLSIPTSNAVIAGTFIALAVTLTILAFRVKKIGHISTHNPFGFSTLSVIGATILFAWLTNVDLIYVRAFTDPSVSGNYAVVATLVKATLIVPGTISLYLLPKFALAESRHRVFTKTMGITLIVSGAGILALAALLGIAGQQIFGILFGSQYQLSNLFLASIALAFLPWVLSQAIMIRVNANARITGVSVLFVASLIQLLLFSQLLPNIEAVIWGNALLGSLCAVALVVTLRTHQRNN